MCPMDTRHDTCRLIVRCLRSKVNASNNIPCLLSDRDLQEIQKDADAKARPALTFRAARRNMKRALQREKLLQERLKVQDFFEA